MSRYREKDPWYVEHWFELTVGILVGLVVLGIIVDYVREYT